MTPRDHIDINTFSTRKPVKPLYPTRESVKSRSAEPCSRTEKLPIPHGFLDRRSKQISGKIKLTSQSHQKRERPNIWPALHHSILSRDSKETASQYRRRQRSSQSNPCPLKVTSVTSMHQPGSTVFRRSGRYIQNDYMHNYASSRNYRQQSKPDYKFKPYTSAESAGYGVGSHQPLSYRTSGHQPKTSIAVKL